MFFTQINQLMNRSVDITMVIRKSATGMTVSVLPKSNGLKDEAQNHIVPLTLSGLPEELDAGFIGAIAKPIRKVSGLLTNMEEFEKQADKAAANSKASKVQKAKETKEEKEKREKYEKHMKKAEIAGEEAAARVEVYNHEVLGMDIPIIYAKDYAERLEKERIAEEQARQEEEQRVAAEKAEAERIAKEQEEQKRLADEKAAQERAEQEQIAAGQEVQTQPTATETQALPYHFALRANLLRWATLTPDLGIEWRINPSWGILVNGSWTSWTWNDKDRRYALWEVNPEVRWYLGERKAWYVGAMFKAGSFNYKLSETGKQGDLLGGGITGGYQLKLNKSLSMDFSLGLGYVNADVEKYKVVEGVRVRQGNETKHWFGPIQAGVTLVWKLF